MPVLGGPGVVWCPKWRPQVDGEREGRSHSFLGEEGPPVGTGTQAEGKARCLHLS